MQINEKTTWIDGSFLYSTSEPWVAAMRSFEGGRLREGVMPNYPPLNDDRIPLINPAPPQIHRLMDPERLFRMLFCVCVQCSVMTCCNYNVLHL